MAEAGQTLEYQIGRTASWIKPAEFDRTFKPPPDQMSGGVVYLMVDLQTRVRGDSVDRYRGYVRRVVAPSGIESSSQIRVDFEPSHQKVTLHHVRIRRGDRVIDQLRPENITVLRRETRLEYQLYDGMKTIDIVLEDVRAGDTVEYAYTLSGTNPALKGMFAQSVNTASGLPIGLFRFRVISPLDSPLHHRCRGVDLKPTVRVLGHWRELEFVRTRVAPLQFDTNLPRWYNPYPGIQISATNRWADVARWGAPLYREPLSLSSELRQEVSRLARAAASPEKRLDQALAMVQRKVRYLGLEIGPNSYRPTDPSVVFKRRFGDCKDKALLLCAVLRRLGIIAHPALVNSHYRRRVSALLPSPLSFDHVIVRAQTASGTWWVDPTDDHLGVPLKLVSNLDYEAALVLRAGVTGLSRLDPHQPAAPEKVINERFDLSAGTGGEAKMVVETVLVGREAESMRASLLDSSPQDLKKSYLNYYATDYPSIAMVGDVRVDDQPLRNRVVVVERYRIPQFWTPQKDTRAKKGEFFPREVWNWVRQPRTKLRSMPLAVPHPQYSRMVTTVLLADEWSIESEKFYRENDALRFTYDVKYEPRKLTLSYEYRTKRDHVPASDTKKYLRDLTEINNEVGYSISAYPDRPLREEMNWPLLVIFLGMLAVALYLAIRVYRRNPPLDPLRPEDTAASSAQLVGLGGLLVLVGIRIMAVPLVLLVSVVVDLSSYSTSTWDSLTNSSSSSYHFWWGPYLIGAMAFYTFVIVSWGLLAVLFLQKRNSFPRLFVICEIASTAGFILDGVVAGLLNQDAGESHEIYRQTVITVLWCSYMVRSRRVRLTFRRRLPDPAEARPQTSE